MSPFRSEKQRRYMWLKHPEIAQEWTDEGKDYVKGKKSFKKKPRKRGQGKRSGRTKTL